jgi:threonylcarbamoyladenosine tRNA methylthiotransferase MtaB
VAFGSRSLRPRSPAVDLSRAPGEAYDLDVDRNPASQPEIRSAAIANLGCKVNQAEMDAVERLLRRRGVALVDGHATADLVVINTCTVTSVAAQKSRQAVRRARRANPDALLLVTGCSVAIDRKSLAGADAAARLYDNEAKDRMLADLASLLELRDGAELPSLAGVEAAVEPGRPFEPEATAGSVADAAEADIDRTRVFVKIQDGCSFHCTYCIIPKARGPERSVPADAVLADVRRGLAAGHREIVLTGINAGTYSEGCGPHATESGLPGLVRRILAETDVERIRLSSIEPQHVTPELLDVWVGSGGRCLPHFHVPLQSGDDTILRRMGRRYDTALYADLAERVRRAIPSVALHADLIVGFPGEDDEAWARTVAFVGGLDLAGMHVFRYSVRPGTPAARMVGQVDARTKKCRADEALALAAEARARYASGQRGMELRVLFERPIPGGRWIGHAENNVLVSASAAGATAGARAASLEGVIGLVRVDAVDPDDSDRLVGSLVSVTPRNVALAESVAT